MPTSETRTAMRIADLKTFCSFQVFDFAHKIGIRVDIMLFDYLILISSIYQYRLSMPKRNPSYKDDGPNEKLGKYSRFDTLLG